jgi:hypothetical protein
MDSMALIGLFFSVVLVLFFATYIGWELRGLIVKRRSKLERNKLRAERKRYDTEKNIGRRIYNALSGVCPSLYNVESDHTAVFLIRVFRKKDWEGKAPLIQITVSLRPMYEEIVVTWFFRKEVTYHKVDEESVTELICQLTLFMGEQGA